jgi:hypothetical protein
MSERNVAQLRVPPNSIESESGVLGGLLLDNAAWDRVGDLLTEADFYRYEHRLVFGAIAQLVNATKPADVFTVYEHLQRCGKHDEAGGLPYLNLLAQYVPSAGNIRRYAEIVRERAILRRLISVSDEIAATAFNPQGQPVDAIVDEAMQKVLAISPETNADEWESMDQMILQQLDMIEERANGQDTKGGDFITTGCVTWMKCSMAACAPGNSSSSVRGPGWARARSLTTSECTWRGTRACRLGSSRWRCKTARAASGPWRRLDVSRCTHCAGHSACRMTTGRG